MFDPNFDPLEQLNDLRNYVEMHHSDLDTVKKNLIQLARGFNEQYEFTKQLVEELYKQTKECGQLRSELTLLEIRLKELEENGKKEYRRLRD